MGQLPLVIFANVAATVAILCGLKLFDIGSDFSDMIRKYGVFLGLVLAFVTILQFLLIDATEVLDGNIVYWTVFVSMVFFAIICRIIEMTKRSLLEPKRKESRKRGRMSKISVVVIDSIDIVTGIAYGVAAGVSFTSNIGTGMMVLCSFILLRLVAEVALIRRYQDAHFTRKENIVSLMLTLCISPVVAVPIYLLTRSQHRNSALLLSIVAGFLIYTCLYHLVMIVVKIRRNR